MRKVHAIEGGERGACAARDRRAHKVAEAVDRAYRGLVEGRHEEGARQMRRVMLDPVHAAADVRFVQAGGARYLAGNPADASQVPRAVPDKRSWGPVAQYVPQLPPSMSGRIAGDGKGVHITGLGACHR